MLGSLGLRRRLRAAGLHLLISAAVAGLAAVLVFGLWYPGPFRLLAGGSELFFLVTSVDVILGPLLTFAVFNSSKGRRHLRYDLTVIGLVQSAALVYGLYTVLQVRPIAMVFEVDRFRLITASDVHTTELPKAPPEYQRLPLAGPWLLSARAPEPGAERQEALFMGLRGIDIGQRPSFWQPYAPAASAALARSRPMNLLLTRYPDRAAELRLSLAAMNSDEASARFLPVTARGDGVAVLDGMGVVLGYLPVDGFF